ncbi:MAG TPA: hypothetical protein VN577_05825 [Terriglobales bacterium]|nr:hypothetical protein [Terriglobales bacterium]
MSSASTSTLAPAGVKVPDSPFPCIKSTGRFLSANWLRVVLLSAVVLVPCFWHKRIQATDLGSHVYNAWLATLIQRGEAPGLYIVPQTSNVLFDVLLNKLFILGPLAAEKVAVSLAVLIFFWGGFAFCSAAARRPAWGISPLLAMVCYGFMFNMGFMNLYLSVGLSLFALAILWCGRRWDIALIAPLFMLIWFGHLLGTAGLLCIGGVLVLMRVLPARWHVPLTAMILLGYLGARWFVQKNYFVLPPETELYWMLGADQLVVYDVPYAWLASGVMALSFAAIALALVRKKAQAWTESSVWILVYAVVAIAVFLAPGGIYHPKLQMMGYLPDRASLYSAVLLCCVLASLKLRKWQVAGFGALAAVFFGMLYIDGHELDRRETQLRALAATLQPRQRVIATMFQKPGSRIHEQHLMDRACVGHCFLVSNYEVASGQFRIKGDPWNRIVATERRVARAMEIGMYPVREEDLPLTQIYACGPGFQQFCTHELRAGEQNGQVVIDEWEKYGKPKQAGTN